jgi:hypothetical protein
MRYVRTAPVRIGLLLALVVVCVSGTARAQSGTATLFGSVSDQQGASIPGATITLTQTGTGTSRTSVSDDGGGYRFVALPPGLYSLRVELSGFRMAIQDKIDLSVDTSTRLDIPLEVGTLSEKVQVTAEAHILNTTDASLGNVINGKQVRELPLEARNVVGLLGLQPGVVYIPKADANTTMDPRFGAVSGARADQSNVTLDGIDVNDGQNQNAFNSVLRVTLDSVQEFRVTTSNYGAEQGRSSGAQVSLVTRSGTNAFAGAGYYVNRDTAFSSNEYFLKLAQLKSGAKNKPPLLNKNIFGGSLGGPIMHDRLFFFGNFEGLNEKRESPVNRAIPSDAFRDGVLIYRCADATACPGGSVAGLTTTHAVAAGFYGMTPADLTRVDPLHIGPSLKASEIFRQYPSPNDQGRDGRNIMGYRFAAPIDNDFRTYISRFDYKMAANQSLFGRMNFQNDTTNIEPQFPGQVANRTDRIKNRGFALGHDWVLSPRLVNALRYGYTLVDSGSLGLRTASTVSFRFIDDFHALTNTNGRNLGTQNITDDLTYLAGNHTFKIGANMRWIRNDFYTNAQSFHSATANGSWVSGVGRVYRPGGTCPAPANCSGLPAVASGDVAVYADSLIDLLGVISQTTARWNYNIDGSTIAVGDPTRRLYGANEYEGYVQDTWRISNTFTVSGGVRYSLFSPPYEVNGVQVAPDLSLGDWFAQRGANAALGIPANASPRMTFLPSGPVNNRKGFYDWDYNNIAPRASFAWTPTSRWVVRGGYSIVYDRAGAGIATSFDSGGSFGLSTSQSSPANRNNEDNPGIRFQGLNVIPNTLPAAAPGGYPATPPVNAGVITQSIDDTLRTPYSHVFNIVVGRDLGDSFTLEGAYVGRRGRNQLMRRDLAATSNLVDKASGMDYFTAARLLLDASKNGVAGMAPIPYWEHLFPGAAGGGLSATQNIAQLFQDNAPDYLTALYSLDEGCDPACSIYGPFAYFTEQYDSLAALSSIGHSRYDAMQATLRKRFSHGYQFDVNYTYARAKDMGSEVERGSVFENFGSGGYSGFAINSWDPELNYSYADYDVRHQINVNGLAELPFGRGKRFGGGAGGALNRVIGGWAIAGIWRWTSGFPFNVQNCRSCWATNWNLQGNAELVQPGVLPATSTTKNAVGGQPSPFTNVTEAIKAFRTQYPGETGIRNLLRGDGYFGIDASVSKSIDLWAGQRIRFRWDVFNLTNTPRFDTGNVTMTPDISTTFGRYNGTLATCDGAAGRCMQVNVRYEF